MKIVEKLDWILRIKKKEKFVYINENILPTMFQFKGDTARINEEFSASNRLKAKKEEQEQNDPNTLLESEEDFEAAVARKEQESLAAGGRNKSPLVQSIFKNMNKSFSNFFS